MGLIDLLSGIVSGSKKGSSSNAPKRYRQETGRYGKKGSYRKERNGDRVGRDPKSGRYR